MDDKLDEMRKRDHQKYKKEIVFLLGQSEKERAQHKSDERKIKNFVTFCCWGSCNVEQKFAQPLLLDMHRARFLWLKKNGFDPILFGIREDNGSWFCNEHWTHIMRTCTSERRTEKGITDQIHMELGEIVRDWKEGEREDIILRERVERIKEDPSI